MNLITNLLSFVLR